MNGKPDPVIRKLDLNRLARLYARLCIADYIWEIMFIVGVRKTAKVPVFYLETLNLVFKNTEKLGGGRGTPSASLPGGSIPSVEYNPKSKEIASEFDMNIDFPAARRDSYKELDPSNHAPGPYAMKTKARLNGRFLTDFNPREYGYQNLECKLAMDVPEEIVEKLGVPGTLDLTELLPMMWIYFNPTKELPIQPVFISADGPTPPTGSDFYPLLANANEIWAKCCIQFRARCPIYVDEQGYRVSTEAEAIAFKDEVDVDDAIEVFVVEQFDPEEMWGGGATFGSGTADAKIVTGDNQLPLNQNHLAHELGHVLGLGHPGVLEGLIDGCAGSVMEPSGFFADNPGFQCRANCRNAANPLLSAVVFPWCLVSDRPDQELY